jgi:hypothetical protein
MIIFEVLITMQFIIPRVLNRQFLVIALQQKSRKEDQLLQDQNDNINSQKNLLIHKKNNLKNSLKLRKPGKESEINSKSNKKRDSINKQK